MDAVFSNNSADYNLYFLPLGGALSPGVNLTCSTCLKATMGVYADWATVKGQPVAGVYIPSAKVVNGVCGKGFVDVNVTVADSGKENGASNSRRGLSWMGLVGGLVVGGFGLGLF